MTGEVYGTDSILAEEETESSKAEDSELKGLGTVAQEQEYQSQLEAETQKTVNYAKPEHRVPNRNTRQLLVGVFIITF